jgi:hypothetical protein
MVLFRTSVIALTIASGVSIVLMLFTDLFWYKPFALPLKTNIADQVLQTQEITFEGLGVIACGSDPAGRATFTSYKASDGAILNSTLIYKIKNEALARKRFNKEIRGASRVIEQNHLRAVVEKAEKIILVSSAKDMSDSDRGLSVSILTAPSLKHVVDFEKRETSLATSFRINHLKQ